MSKFQNLRYQTRSGVAAPVNTSHPDNPLTGKSEHALRAADTRDRKIIWESDGTTHEFCPKYGWAALDPGADLLVVIVGSDDLPFPNNGVVINSDGTRNHQIFSPEFVELSGDGLPAELHRVDSMSDIYIDENEKTVIGLDFRYEWVERRYYDPMAKQWGGRVLIYRR